MSSQHAASLMLQAEKVLPGPIRPELIAYCPTMDMVAVVTGDENLDVYRLKGQRAFTRKRKDDTSSVDSICWKFNGKSIAVAWSDLTVDVISTETGKVAPQTFKNRNAKTQDPLPARITCLAWESNFINTLSIESKIRTASKENASRAVKPSFTDDWEMNDTGISLNDVLQGHLDLSVLDPTPDLSDQIALLDLERLLPKLPVLSSPPMTPFTRPTHTVPEVFTSQSSIDSIFHSHHLEYANAVNALLLCHADGKVSPKVYSSLDTTSVRLPNGWSTNQKTKILHSTHPFSRSHCLLMDISGQQSSVPGRSAPAKSKTIEEERPFKFKTCLVPLTFRFIASAGLQVHLIGSKQQQLENLLYYILESLRSISTYWYHSQDLPRKFIRNINETLSEKDEGDVTQNLFHLAVTGHCPAPVKEWLVDELTESGHKRWDHAVMQGYSKVIEISHENLVPAVDRCTMVASLLRGLATYDDSGSVFDVPASDFTNILETLKCLRLLGHNVINYAREERRQFVAFSRWLRDEIDTQASDPSSTSAEDGADRDIGVEYTHVLEFIRGSLCSSRLDHFIHKQPKPETPDDPVPSMPTYEEICKTLEQFKAGQTVEPTSIDTWVVGLRFYRQCQSSFAKIGRWQASNTNINSGIVLEEDEISAARDLRTIQEVDAAPHTLATYVVLVPKSGSNEIRCHRIVHSNSFDDVSKTTAAKDACSIRFGKGLIRDVRFVDEDYIMALFKTTDASYLVSIPYAHKSGAGAKLPWPEQQKAPDLSRRLCPAGHADPDRAVLDLSSQGSLEPFVKHTFLSSDRFVPLRLEVNGRKRRRVVCVVGEDLRHYKVFDLDWSKEDDVNKSTLEEEIEDSDIDMEE